MAKRKQRDRDGVFVRNGSYYISFMDARGRRRQRKLRGVHTLTQARNLRTAELQKAERARVLGYTPPGKENSFRGIFITRRLGSPQKHLIGREESWKATCETSLEICAWPT